MPICFTNNCSGPSLDLSSIRPTTYDSAGYPNAFFDTPSNVYDSDLASYATSLRPIDLTKRVTVFKGFSPLVVKSVILNLDYSYYLSGSASWQRFWLDYSYDGSTYTNLINLQSDSTHWAVGDGQFRKVTLTIPSANKNLGSLSIAFTSSCYNGGQYYVKVRDLFLTVTQ
jgi:hypothetical protein